MFYMHCFTIFGLNAKNEYTTEQKPYKLEFNINVTKVKGTFLSLQICWVKYSLSFGNIASIASGGVEIE